MSWWEIEPDWVGLPDHSFSIILATLPLALIGALPGLWITGNPLGFMPQLGILALFGIVLNTGIIFMEFADILIQDAAKRSDGSGPICGLTVSQFRDCLVDYRLAAEMPASRSRTELHPDWR